MIHNARASIDAMALALGASRHDYLETVTARNIPVDVRFMFRPAADGDAADVTITGVTLACDTVLTDGPHGFITVILKAGSSALHLLPRRAIEQLEERLPHPEDGA